MKPFNMLDHTCFTSAAAADMCTIKAIQSINNGKFVIPRYHTADYLHSMHVWDESEINEFIRWAWHVEGGSLPKEVLPLILNINVDKGQDVKALPYACFIQIGEPIINANTGLTFHTSADAELMREVQKHRAWKGKNTPMTVYHAALNEGLYFVTDAEQKRFTQSACDGVEKPFRGSPFELHFPKNEQQEFTVSYACTIIRGARLPIAWLP